MPDTVFPHPKPPRPKFYFREWRKKRGFTQEELGEMIGLSAPSISQLENGKQGFTDSTLLAISDALSCSPADLLMRNPLDETAPWTVWENIQKSPPEKRRAIVAVIETMLKTGTNG